MGFNPKRFVEDLWTSCTSYGQTTHPKQLSCDQNFQTIMDRANYMYTASTTAFSLEAIKLLKVDEARQKARAKTSVSEQNADSTH